MSLLRPYRIRPIYAGWDVSDDVLELLRPLERGWPGLFLPSSSAAATLMDHIPGGPSGGLQVTSLLPWSHGTWYPTPFCCRGLLLPWRRIVYNRYSTTLDIGRKR